jgi:lycopene cyclase domain-containing protein
VRVDRWQYLIVLGACLLITAPLELFGRGVYRQPRRAVYAVLPVAVVFLLWDATAVAAHVWWYNPRFILGVIAVVAVCAMEFGVLRTGLFRRPAYWIAMVIVIGFQILVDGWLTKLSAPLVIYDNRYTSGIRFPFDIPVEDFLFGFALLTAVLLQWERRGPRPGGSEQR